MKWIQVLEQSNTVSLGCGNDGIHRSKGDEEGPEQRGNGKRQV